MKMETDRQYQLTFDSIAPLGAVSARYEVRVADPIADMLVIDHVEIPVSHTMSPWELYYQIDAALIPFYDGSLGDLVGLMYVKANALKTMIPPMWNAPFDSILRAGDPVAMNDGTGGESTLNEGGVMTATNADNPDLTSLDQFIWIFRVHMANESIVTVRLLEVTGKCMK